MKHHGSSSWPSFDAAPGSVGSPPQEWWRPDVVAESSDQARLHAKDSAGRDSKVPFWALMGFTFVLLLAPQSYVPALASMRIALLMAAVAVAAHLVDRFIQLQPLTILNREIWITACLVGWAIITIPLSYWPGGSVSYLFGFYVKSLAVFWLVGNVVNTPGRLRVTAWALTLMAMLLALSGVNAYVSGDFIPDSRLRRIYGYDAPLSTNPNDLALMLNLTLPMSLALLMATRRLVVRIVLLGIILLQASAIMLTLSRAGFLALATTCVVYLARLVRRPERAWVLCALGFLLVAALFVPSSYLDRLSTIVDIESDQTGSAQGRWKDMVAAGVFVLKNPIIGAGLGADILALNEARGPRWSSVHNVYLQYAVELGIPGLGLFLGLLVGCLRKAGLVRWRCSRVPPPRELAHLAEGIELSLIAFTVSALFHPVAYHIYFYYFAGLAVAVNAVYESRDGGGAPGAIRPGSPAPAIGPPDNPDE